MSYKFGAACQYPRHRVAVAADVLRRRVDHEIHSQRDRPLEYRCGPGIIDDRQRPVAACQGRQGADVVGLHGPAGRAFEVQQFCAGKSRLDSLKIGAVDVIHCDFKLLEQRLEKTISIRIDVTYADHPILRLDKGEHGAGDGRHAAGEADGVFGFLQLRHLAFEHRHRRISGARIDIARAFSREGVRHFREAVEGKQRGLRDRWHYGFIGMSVRIMGEQAPRSRDGALSCIQTHAALSRN